MKNEKLIRSIYGIKSILRNKGLIIIPAVYLILMVIILYKGNYYLNSLINSDRTKIFRMIFFIIITGISYIGLKRILVIIGTPIGCKNIEQGLKEVGFTDRRGDAPLLLSKVKSKNGITMEFYSSRIPLNEYEKHRDEIETVMNIKIVSIDYGIDAQHVILRAIPSISTKYQMIKWNHSFLADEDFILKLGKSYFGEEGFDLSVTPHVMIGGGSGSGKSNLLKLLLVQCINKGADIYLADFKGGIDYSKLWHEKCSIIVSTDKLLLQLTYILELMEDRRKILVKSGATNIKEHNQKTEDNMKRIIVACDEIAEVLDKTGLEKDEKLIISQIESKLSTIARQGRAFGIHLILATQRPDSDIIKGQIKNNIGMRICGRADKVLSQIILDNIDASNKISQKDQGLFLTNMNVLFQGYYISDDCLEEE